MNLVTKAKPWMVASLLAATSVFGQNQSCPPQKSAPPVCQPVQPTCQPQVCKPAKCGTVQAPQMPMIAAYNAPAETNIGMQGEIDFFVSGSFLYWQPLQDNMDVALTNFNTIPQLLTNNVGFQGAFVDMNFRYKPGFKVGAGLNLQDDDWVGYAEYTRLHGRHTVSSSGPNGVASNFATWGHPFLLEQVSQVFNTVGAAFNCNLDFVDAQMERVYYVGKYLVFHSSWGARGAWITENMHVHYLNNTGTIAITAPTAGPVVTSLPSVVDVYGRVHSWAVGPKVGVEMDWMLGDGIRFFGSTFADVLYTRYKVQDKTVAMPLVTNVNVVAGNTYSFITYDKVSALRAHLDLEAGFGWGMYFDNNAWHLDLSAAYGFQVFFNQNMFQHFNSSAVLGNHLEEHGNLYVQGLTATARVDF